MRDGRASCLRAWRRSSNECTQYCNSVSGSGSAFVEAAMRVLGSHRMLIAEISMFWLLRWGGASLMLAVFRVGFASKPAVLFVSWSLVVFRVFKV